MEASLWLTLILITGPFAGALAASDSSSSSQTAGNSKYDCDRGCPLNTYPVCGIDGEWYQNACMAFCAKMTVDSTTAACAGAPMPFEDAKPGPHGAESGRPGGVTRLIDKGVINAFKQEGLRYVGRIRLAREMGPRPKTIGSNMRMPEPQDDGSGHWRVATLRCTADGDIYKGTISVPMAAMDLKAFEPNRLLGNLFKGMSSRSRAPEKPVTEQLLQESGSYSTMDPSLSDIPGMFDPSRQPEALPEFHTEQQRPQWQRPLNYLWGVWGKMKDAADSLTALVRPASVNGPSIEAGSSSDVEVAGAGSSSSSDRQEVASAAEEDVTLWTAPNEAEESAAPGGAHTISFESAKALSAAAAYADGPFSSSDSGNVVGGPGLSSSSSDASAEALDESAADAGLLSEVMGDIADDGSIGAAYSVGNVTTAGNRRLLEIINGDDRFLCEKGYPYTAIGQIQVVDNTGLYICTGVLIRPNKVLTAAHCVWNTKRNAFYYNLNFAPGRYRHDGKMVNPWGVVPWKSVTVFDAFKKDPATWDVAVVTLSKNLGSVTGYMGMAAGCSSNTDLTLAGYPQDQAQGTCMANTCRVPYLDCNALTNIHTCDTIMGMSGSPLWDSKNRIRMIHVAGIAGRPENRATTVTQFLINTISKW